MMKMDNQKPKIYDKKSKMIGLCKFVHLFDKK